MTLRETTECPAKELWEETHHKVEGEGGKSSKGAKKAKNSILDQTTRKKGSRSTTREEGGRDEKRQSKKRDRAHTSSKRVTRCSEETSLHGQKMARRRGTISQGQKHQSVQRPVSTKTKKKKKAGRGRRRTLQFQRE